jgi:hypothetical protein
MHVATAATTARNTGDDDDDDDNGGGNNNNNNNNNKSKNGTTHKLFRKCLINVPGKNNVKEMHKIAILNTVHILRKCLCKRTRRLSWKIEHMYNIL